MNVSSWVTLTYPILTGHYSDWHQHLEANDCNLLQTMAFHNMCRNRIRQNNILDLVITTEEALLETLQIKDKIGDHQAIQFSLQTEKATEKTNYKFRMANF